MPGSWPARFFSAASSQMKKNDVPIHAMPVMTCAQREQRVQPFENLGGHRACSASDLVRLRPPLCENRLRLRQRKIAWSESTRASIGFGLRRRETRRRSRSRRRPRANWRRRCGRAAPSRSRRGTSGTARSLCRCRSLRARSVPSVAQASRIATTSACAVGSFDRRDLVPALGDHLPVLDDDRAERPAGFARMRSAESSTAWRMKRPCPSVSSIEEPPRWRAADRAPCVVAEWGDTTQVDLTFSVAKSYLSILAGLAFDRGLIRDLHEPVCRTPKSIGTMMAGSRRRTTTGSPGITC